jgi:crotonobetainyl-CoA:carnitine CoA-transferase CaiB-like acyl-CoA transferase
MSSTSQSLALPATSGPLPLVAVRVLDFSRLLPGPYCSQILADLGAEVIRIDDATRPDGGDLMREEADLEGFGGGRFFDLINRGKKSIALNLRDPRAVEIVKRLVVDADIVLEGFRPGVMQRLGVGYAALATVKPSLVYCALSGYGQTGPYRDKAGHDLNYLALSGGLHHNRAHDSGPAIGTVQTADLAGGALSAATAILAALLDAKLNGRGRFLDVAMADGALALNVYALSLLNQRREEPASGAELITGGAACYQVYATQDQRYLAVGALEQKFWQRFCEILNRPDLSDRGHRCGQAGRAVIADVAATIAKKTLTEWCEIFKDEDCCVSPVMTLEESLQHGPSVRRGAVALDSHAQPVLPFPVQMAAAPIAVAASPAIGADTESLLSAAGYAADEISELMAEGVVLSHRPASEPSR